jgi:hypothetical protein
MNIVVHEEYLNLLKIILERYKTDNVDKLKVLSHLSESKSVPKMDEVTTFTLTADRNEHPIKWVEKNGKIFELSGPNLRNKTTTLIYLATLLGFNWEGIEAYLKDNKIVDQSKVIMDEISSGIAANLVIENSIYRFEVKIIDAKANIVKWNKKDAKDPYEQILDISLLNDVDWKIYREKVKGFFDVQVIGKGRNFVIQVGLEEAKNHIFFCDEVIKFISGYTQLLYSQKPKYNPSLLKNEIEDIKQKIQGDNDELNQVTESREILKVKFSQAVSDFRVVNEILNTANFKDMLNLSLLWKEVDDLYTLLKEGESRLPQLNEEYTELTEIINQQSQNIDLFQDAIKDLRDAFEITLPNLSLPSSLSDELIKALADNDVTRIIYLGKRFWIDDSTYDLLSKISQSNFSGISNSTKLFGIEVLNKYVGNLSEFRDALSIAAANTVELNKIKGYFAEFFNLVEKLGYDTTEKYSLDISGLNALRIHMQSISDEKRNLTISLEEKRNDYNRLIEPYGNITQLKELYEDSVSKIDENILRKIDKIANRYSLNIDFQFGTKIDQIKMDLGKQIQEFDFKIEDLERLIEEKISKRKKKEKILTNTKAVNDVDSRISSLLKTKGLLQNISEYFTHKKYHFETSDVKIKARLEDEIRSNEFNLGADFNFVIDIINERIRSRCPFALVNTNNGIEKRAVISFDFLKQDFAVDGLEEGSKYHGGINSTMTVYGLATNSTGAELGSILLVDEWGDVGVYKEKIYEEICKINFLSMAIFVDVDESLNHPVLEKRR